MTNKILKTYRPFIAMNLLKGAVLFFILLFTSQAFSQSPQDRQIADQYLNNSEYDKAAQIYERLMNSDPFGTYSQYLRCLLAMKDYDAAEKLVKRIMKKQPDYPSYYVDLGFVYFS